MLSLVHTTLKVGIIAGFELDVVQRISREIRDQTLGVKKVILSFPSLLRQIYW